jgi:CheY-like chemotaxis protein
MSVSILVVDDEPDVADLFRQRFRHEARQDTYLMHFAASGEQALGLLSGGIEPQLIVILSDINMRVTAYGDEERLYRAAEYGAAEFITKPADFDLLKEQLRHLPSAAG